MVSIGIFTKIGFQKCLNSIVSYCSFCSSDSRTEWLLGTSSKDIFIYQYRKWNICLIQLFHVTAIVIVWLLPTFQNIISLRFSRIVYQSFFCFVFGWLLLSKVTNLSAISLREQINFDQMMIHTLYYFYQPTCLYFYTKLWILTPFMARCTQYNIMW
jgi:hypothetical protein